MILIINEQGARLCNDDCWRDFASFGTVSGCVKEYKSLGRARIRARHIKGIVVQLPKDMSVDASGCVFDELNQKRHTLKEFAV